MSQATTATDQATSVSNPVLKAATALLAGVGVSSWSDFAALLAAVYTLCLLAEWLWQRFLRPAAESRGWVQRKRRRHTDWDDDDA